MPRKQKRRRPSLPAAERDYFAGLARNSLAARKGTEKARAHAATISVKRVAARRRKTEERKTQQAAEKS